MTLARARWPGRVSEDREGSAGGSWTRGCGGGGKSLGFILSAVGEIAEFKTGWECHVCSGHPCHCSDNEVEVGMVEG